MQANNGGASPVPTLANQPGPTHETGQKMLLIKSSAIPKQAPIMRDCPKPECSSALRNPPDCFIQEIPNR